MGHRTQAEIKMTWTGGARSELATKLHSDDHRLSEIQKVCEEIKIPSSQITTGTYVETLKQKKPISNDDH